MRRSTITRDFRGTAAAGCWSELSSAHTVILALSAAVHDDMQLNVVQLQLIFISFSI